jgi:hypothetical protein
MVEKLKSPGVKTGALDDNLTTVRISDSYPRASSIALEAPPIPGNT